MIAWGDKDPWEPIELGRAFGKFDSVEDFVVLPNVGHCPQVSLSLSLSCICARSCTLTEMQTDCDLIWLYFTVCSGAPSQGGEHWLYIYGSEIVTLRLELLNLASFKC